jgi:hypothetical protein
MSATHPATNADGTCSDAKCPCHDFSKRGSAVVFDVDANEGDLPAWEPMLTITEHDLRAAVLRVIDDGDGHKDDPFPYQKVFPYALWHPFEPVADEARTRFTDAVIARARQFAEGRG